MTRRRRWTDRPTGSTRLEVSFRFYQIKCLIEKQQYQKRIVKGLSKKPPLNGLMLKVKRVFCSFQHFTNLIGLNWLSQRGRCDCSISPTTRRMLNFGVNDILGNGEGGFSVLKPRCSSNHLVNLHGLWCLFMFGVLANECSSKNLQ